MSPDFRKLKTGNFFTSSHLQHRTSRIQISLRRTSHIVQRTLCCHFV